MNGEGGINLKRALVTGVTGQDGSYLLEFLLSKGYEVHGIIRRSSVFNTERIDHLRYDPKLSGRVHLHYGDLLDSSRLTNLLYELRPDEIYNLGAQSHVKVSFEMPEYTSDVDGLGVARLLDAVRTAGLAKNTRFYQASSSEMFGNSATVPQSESTPFQPNSPYAVAKLYGHFLVRNYRESYGIHASSGILFNHESPRRAETFVTRKIVRAATRIKLGLKNDLRLGNLEAKRDWGYAPEYVEAMWKILQLDQPDDFVVATGEAYSVREFVQECFEQLDMDWRDYVKFDPAYLRPVEVHHLLGDSSKARDHFGWEPKTNFRELVKIMVNADLQLAQNEKILRDNRRDI